MLRILQERLSNQLWVHVAALQLGEQSVRVKVPDLIQVPEDEVSFEEGEVTELHLVPVSHQHHLQVIHIVHLSVAHLFYDVLPPEITPLFLLDRSFVSALVLKTKL